MTLFLWIRGPGNVSGLPWLASQCDGLRLWLAGIESRPVTLIGFVRPESK